MAELGSLNLEFTRLSQLTGDSKYYDAIQRIADHMEDAQMKTKIPGLWPVMVDAQELTFNDARFTVGGMADSTYEYLPKEHMLLGGRNDQWRNMYNAAIDAIKESLLFRGMTKEGADVLFAGDMYGNLARTKGSLEPQAEHLKCFLGGTVGIGTKVFERPEEELRIARGLTDGCIWAYDSMPTGLMPETMYVSACNDLEECKWDEQKWYMDIDHRSSHSATDELAVANGKAIAKESELPPGMTEIPDVRYYLRYPFPILGSLVLEMLTPPRPEAIESVFIMYRITGDQALQDAAWRMFQSIEKRARTQYAHAAIDDVRNPASDQLDYMESFWLAETLKYFYLIFSEPSVVSLDEYVL